MKIVRNHTFIKHYTEMLIHELSNYTDDMDTDLLKCLITDGSSFLLAIKKEIEQRTLDMMLTKLSPADFAGFIRSRQDQLEMKSLRKRGLIKTDIDRWRKNIIDSILSTALDLAGGRLILNTDNPRKR